MNDLCCYLVSGSLFDRATMEAGQRGVHPSHRTEEWAPPVSNLLKEGVAPSAVATVTMAVDASISEYGKCTEN